MVKEMKPSRERDIFEVLMKVHGINWSSEQEFLERLNQMLNKKQVLELGCYTGELHPHFQKYGAEIEGIDNDIDAVREANSLGRTVHLGDIDDPDGAIGMIRGRLADNPGIYDLIFSHDLFTPSAIVLPKTIRNSVEVPTGYLKSGGYLVHMVTLSKGLHDYNGPAGKLLEKLGRIQAPNKLAIAWRKR